MGLLLDGTSLEMGYVGGIVVLMIITTAYIVFGGLTAVIWTDVMQSVLLLFAGVLVAVLTFSQAEVGGFAAMLARDAALPAAEQKMHLYLPSDHPQLPWTGALSGLLLLHIFYWSTNSHARRHGRARGLRPGRPDRRGPDRRYHLVDRLDDELGRAPDHHRLTDSIDRFLLIVYRRARKSPIAPTTSSVVAGDTISPAIT